MTPTAIPTPVPTAVPTNPPALVPSQAVPIIPKTPTPLPASTPIPALPTPKITVLPSQFKGEDDRLPHQGSMTWELGAAAIFYGYQDLSTFISGTINPPTGIPLEFEVDFGGDLTVIQSLQIGAQVQYLAKQSEVVFSNYVTSVSGSPVTAITTSTWSENCAGAVLDVKYLFPLDHDFRLMLDAQGGYYTLLNTTFEYQGDTYQNLNLSSSALGGTFSAKIEWVADPGKFALDLGVGYRALSFSSITASTLELSGQSTLGSGASIDFSGPRFDLTARFF
jgi:hypothetical protein